ncbi:hypothetical protein N321_00781, partial [Antrostomus carolinensis]
GPIKLKVPLSIENSDAWKLVAKGHRDDPARVAKGFKAFVKALDVDWEDVDLMLDALTDTEKELVLKTARNYGEIKIRDGEDIDDYFPQSKPHWDYNNADHYQLLRQYRESVAFELENGIPKAVNWASSFAIKQNSMETPTEFLD